MLHCNFHGLYRTRVYNPLSSPEVHGWDGGLLHLVLRESHHCVVDHASEWYEVSKVIKQCCRWCNLSTKKTTKHGVHRHSHIFFLVDQLCDVCMTLMPSTTQSSSPPHRPSISPLFKGHCQVHHPFHCWGDRWEHVHRGPAEDDGCSSGLQGARVGVWGGSHFITPWKWSVKSHLCVQYCQFSELSFT